MNAADVIAARLAAAGCRLAFGIPGGEVLALVDALGRAGVRFELTRHENAAGFMAEGAWHAEGHATGTPGVLVATVGPGIANGLVSGGPQLGAGAAVGTGLAAGGALVAASAAGGMALRGGAAAPSGRRTHP